jgi:hypothetical protein
MSEFKMSPLPSEMSPLPSEMLPLPSEMSRSPRKSRKSRKRSPSLSGESDKRSSSLSESRIMTSSEDEPSGTNQMVITVARMNPPTPGHMVLVKTMISIAYDNDIKNVYIVLSSTAGDEKNPLPCPEKKEVLDLMIDSLKEIMIREDPKCKVFMRSVNVKTICVPRETPNLFSVISTLFSPQKDPSKGKVIIVLGEDRSDLAESITAFYLNKVKAERETITSILLERESMDKYKKLSENPDEFKDIDVRTIPAESMSGSLVRNAVKYGMTDKFQEIYDPWLDPEIIGRLYGLIQHGLATAKSTKPKTPKRPRKGGKRTRRKPRKLKRFLYKKNTKYFQKNDD